jgi:hypothetical protein
VAGAGTRLPDVLWHGMLAALGVPDDWRAGLDVIEVSRFTRVIGPTGATDAVAGTFGDAFAPECPAAGELLRRSAI